MILTKIKFYSASTLYIASAPLGDSAASFGKGLLLKVEQQRVLVVDLGGDVAGHNMLGAEAVVFDAPPHWIEQPQRLLDGVALPADEAQQKHLRLPPPLRVFPVARGYHDSFPLPKQLPLGGALLPAHGAVLECRSRVVNEAAAARAQEQAVAADRGDVPQHIDRQNGAGAALAAHQLLLPRATVTEPHGLHRALFDHALDAQVQVLARVDARRVPVIPPLQGALLLPRDDGWQRMHLCFFIVGKKSGKINGFIYTHIAVLPARG